MKKDIINSNPEKWIEEELSILKNVPERSQANVKKGREKFEFEVKGLQKSVTFSRDNRLYNKGIKFFPVNSGARPVSSLVMALLIALLMLFGSISSVVYASQGALPDETLYPLKLLQENVQLSLARTQQERVDLNITFTNRRLDEIVQLQTKGRLLSQSILDRLSQQIDQTLLSIDALDQTDQKLNALLNLQKNVEKHQAQLQKMEGQANPRAIAERTRLGAILKTRLDLLAQGLRDPQELHRIMMQQKEEIKEETKEAPGQIKKSEATAVENNGADKATDAAEDKKDKEEKEKATPETKNTHAVKTPEPISTEALSGTQSSKDKNNNGTTGNNNNSTTTNNGNSNSGNNSNNNSSNNGNSGNNSNSGNENSGNGNGNSNNGNNNNENNGNGNINSE